MITRKKVEFDNNQFPLFEYFNYSNWIVEHAETRKIVAICIFVNWDNWIKKMKCLPNLLCKFYDNLKYWISFNVNSECENV